MNTDESTVWTLVVDTLPIRKRSYLFLLNMNIAVLKKDPTQDGAAVAALVVDVGDKRGHTLRQAGGLAIAIEAALLASRIFADHDGSTRGLTSLVLVLVCSCFCCSRGTFVDCRNDTTQKDMQRDNAF